MHLDKELKKNSRPQHFFNLQPASYAHFLQHLPAFPDKDCLLPFALAINYCCDPCELCSFLELLDSHRGRIWHLFACGRQDLLPDNFRSDEACRLIRSLILGKVTWTLRQCRQRFL